MYFTGIGISAVMRVHHWQITLLIFNTLSVVLSVFYDVATASEDMQDWKLSAGFTFTISLFIYSFLKNYVEEYVHPEKI